MKSYAVTLIVYCLIPNHYHLLTRQDGENTFSLMMQAFGTSLSKTYNEKYFGFHTLFDDVFQQANVPTLGESAIFVGAAALIISEIVRLVNNNEIVVASIDGCQINVA